MQSPVEKDSTLSLDIVLWGSCSHEIRVRYARNKIYNLIIIVLQSTIDTTAELYYEDKCRDTAL